MKNNDILDPKQKRILNDLYKQLNRPPTTGEIVWKALQNYFIQLGGRG